MPTATPVPAATPVSGQVALTINGSVSNPLSLTVTKLKAYVQLTVNETITDSNGNTVHVTGTGPSLNALLAVAGTNASSKNITFIAPGNVKTIPISAVDKSMNATIIIQSDGSLRDVIPGQNPDAWVGNLTAITIS